MVDIRKEISAGIVLFDIDNKVLLIRQKNWDFWGFPKGHIEEWETQKQAAKRELLEETSIEVLDKDFLSDEIFEISYEFMRDDVLVKKESVFMVARVQKNLDIVVQEEEVLESGFFDIQQARKLIEDGDFEYENSQLNIFDKVLEVFPFLA